MAETIQQHDFVDVDYTGKLPDGTIFDTTSEKIAKEHHLGEKRTFGPIIICIGERQILPGLDQQLIGKELAKEYTVTLPPEQAFGKRDIKKMKIVPASTFREHKMEPHPGLQIDVDGEIGTVAQVSGGRVIVNFNHPLAGKEVSYTFTINRKVTDQQEQLKAFLQTAFGIPTDKLPITIQDGKATIELPLALPAEITSLLGKKLQELVKLNAVEFKTKEPVNPPSIGTVGVQ
ncbi:peptidylprolyl isomerase [Candidatus Woesearchaeota archaeon]|nr:peptidylprolyl isomerase [Candidatus Woesearchaeota archaeon]